MIAWLQRIAKLLAMTALIYGLVWVVSWQQSGTWAPEDHPFTDKDWAATLSIPYTFSSGTPIYSSQMNANFSAIESVVNSLDDNNISNGSITGSSKLIDGTVSLAKMGSNSVNSAKVVDASLTSDDLGTSSVDTDELATDSVTNPKLADDAVDTDEIADGAVTEYVEDYAAQVEIASATTDYTIVEAVDLAAVDASDPVFLSFSAVAEWSGTGSLGQITLTCILQSDQTGSYGTIQTKVWAFGATDQGGWMVDVTMQDVYPVGTANSPHSYRVRCQNNSTAGDFYLNDAHLAAIALHR